MVHEEYLNDIRLNAVRNSSIFHNETQIITIPRWLQELPEKVINLSSQTDVIRREIAINLNKPESPLYFLTFIISLFTIILITLLLLSLCCWFCWRYGKLLNRFKIKKSKKISDKEEKMQNITNVNVHPSSQGGMECKKKEEKGKRVEIESEERITIDRYDKPTRSGIYGKSQCDNYFPEESYICSNYGEFGIDKFEKKETCNYPIEQKKCIKVGGESYGSILLKNGNYHKGIDCEDDNKILKTETYEIGRC